MAKKGKFTEELENKAAELGLTEEAAGLIDYVRELEDQVLSAPLGRKGDAAQEYGLPPEWGVIIEVVNNGSGPAEEFLNGEGN